MLETMNVFVAWGDDLDKLTPKPTDLFVVIDVLRASTTLSVLFSRGVSDVFISTSVEQTIRKRNEIPGSIACGERGGYPPKGFDYGNSPVEFLSANLEGKTVILTTTNFTRITDAVLQLDITHIYSGNMVGRKGLISHLLKILEDGQDQDLWLIPAGRKEKAFEDMVGAQYILKDLITKIEINDISINGIGIDPKLVDRNLLIALSESSENIYNEIADHSKHAKYLLEQGGRFVKDVEFATRLDTISDIVIKYYPELGSFRQIS